MIEFLHLSSVSGCHHAYKPGCLNRKSPSFLNEINLSRKLAYNRLHFEAKGFFTIMTLFLKLLIVKVIQQVTDLAPEILNM